MALVNVINMAVLDNPSNFLNPFQFEITFECLQELDDDLEWKVLYVVKAEDVSSDVILDEILVGPVPVGVNKFVLQADAPNPKQLSQDDLLGVTVVLVTCSYREREFVRVGYYVNNEYMDDNYNAETDGAPPKPLDMTKVARQILADKPRVTKFPIPWGNPEQENVTMAAAGVAMDTENSASNQVSVSPSSRKDGAEPMEEDDALPASVSSE